MVKSQLALHLMSIVSDTTFDRPSIPLLGRNRVRQVLLDAEKIRRQTASWCYP